MFKISSTPLDINAIREACLASECGGYCSFEGWVRNHHQGKHVKALSYEAYTELGEKEGNLVIQEALTKFEIEHAYAVHRVGDLAIGELAVAIGVSSAHREASFDACRYIIEQIKARVPIWKHEHYVDGSNEWVACHCGVAANHHEHQH